MRTSPGADFIIDEAMREDTRPLYVAMQGSATDLAIAIKKEPRITSRMTAIWIGGGAYPDGGEGDFNLSQDILAARILMESSLPLWQIPCNVYATMETSLAELAVRVRPCGQLGRYLFEQLYELNTLCGVEPGPWPHGESWCLGDNPTVTVLLEGNFRAEYHDEYAPVIGDDMRYQTRITGRNIRVYDHVDSRLTLEDLFAKLQICFKDK